MVVENGARVSKILQVFSKQVYIVVSHLQFRFFVCVLYENCLTSLWWNLFQAVMMDALISVFVEELKRKSASAAYHDETDRPVYDTATDSDGEVFRFF